MHSVLLIALSSALSSAPLSTDLFVDKGDAFLRVGAKDGLRVGMEFTVLGDTIGDTEERRTIGRLAVVEIWSSLARVNLDAAARANVTPGAIRIASSEIGSDSPTQTATSRPPLPPPSLQPRANERVRTKHHDTEKWRDGDAVPEGYHRIHRARTGFVAAGSVFASIGYTASATFGVICAANSYSCSGNEWMFVPLLGPFVALGYPRSSIDTTMLVTSGLVQIVGVGLIVLGALGHNTIERDKFVDLLRVSPILIGEVGRGGYGVQVGLSI